MQNIDRENDSGATNWFQVYQMLGDTGKPANE